MDPTTVPRDNDSERPVRGVLPFSTFKLLNGSSLPSISLCSCSKDVAEVHGVLAAAHRRSLTTQDYTQRPLKADPLASIQPNHPSGGRDGIETKGNVPRSHSTSD
nr:uncharacterized protein LOC123765265 isoform X1 [Procambarus clarkii]